MTDHSMMKLGRYKSPKKLLAKCLHLADYLDVPKLPPPPVYRDWTANIVQPFGMMMNDTIGDCTCAGAGHAIQTLTSAGQGTMLTITDADVLAAYEAITGYDPKDPSTDNGACLVDVLNYWVKNGIGGHKIAGFVTVNAKNAQHLQAACEFFGGTYSGVGLPITSQTQDIWDVPAAGLSGEGAPYSWGGHCIWVPAYDKCITWGERKQFTPAFETAYIDERHAIITTDFINQKTATSPDGLKFQQLQAALQQIKDAA